MLFVVALLGVPAPAFPVTISEMNAQTQALRERNQMIRAKLDRQRTLTQQLKQRIDGLERKDEVIVQEITRVAERPALGFEPAEIVPTSRINIKLFGDFGYTYYHQDNDTFDNAFWIGRQELFLSGAVSEKFTGIMEVVYGRDRLEPEVPRPRIDRGFLRYNLSEPLNVQVGLFHTPIGYWLEEFEHAAWLRTTVFEPEIYTTHQGEVVGNRIGGWLPIHNVGVDVFGTLELPGVDLGYDVGLFNGRTQALNRLVGSAVQGADSFDAVADQNDFKAINARVSLAPSAFLGGLEFGAGVYIDEIPAERSTSVPVAQRFLEGISETIVSGFLAYRQDPLEVLGETFYLRHRDHDRNHSFGTWAHYLQLGYRLREKYTPYYRFDYMDFGNGDPYWDGLDIDRAQHTIGVRWDVSAWNALKLEYTHVGLQGLEDEQQVVVNSSWVF